MAETHGKPLEVPDCPPLKLLRFAEEYFGNTATYIFFRPCAQNSSAQYLDGTRLTGRLQIPVVAIYVGPNCSARGPSDVDP